jgi:uncharacterized RDD family membrane protein YckC
MFCGKCGGLIADGATFCPACGQPIGAAAAGAPQTGVAGAAPMDAYSAGAYGATAVRPVAYAGFWLRFVAIIIDGILIGIVSTPFRIAILAMMGMHTGGLFGTARPEDPAAMLAILFPIIMISVAVSGTINWLYFAFCESSSWQGTLGKKALGLQVTDLEGNRISFGRASGRFFAKIISGMILMIGYIMAGFTAKKQALHDMIAGCLVIKKM